MARSCRSEIFEADCVGVYHCINRCVRRAFLCGDDPLTGCNYEHRRGWIRNRLELLAGIFGIDVLGYTILGNHLHLVLRNRPDVVAGWTDEEVARRWYRLCPSRKRADGTAEEPNRHELAMITNDPERIAELRARLSHPSWLMKMLCQDIARRSNCEDRCSGRFWEGRYKMTRLLEESAVLACMAYVDLNPIRAGMADSLDEYEQVSIRDRLESLDSSPMDPAGWLAPLELQSEKAIVSSPADDVESRPASTSAAPKGAEACAATSPKNAHPRGNRRRASDRGCLPMHLNEYVRLLEWLATAERPCAGNSTTCRDFSVLKRLRIDAHTFLEVVRRFDRLFRTVAGSPQHTEEEATRRGRRWLQSPGASHLEPKTVPQT